MRILIIGWLLLASIAWAKDTAPTYLEPDLPQVALVGKGVLRWFGIKVYEARLWAEHGQYAADKPYALELIYGHTFTAEELAKEGAKQMRKQGVEEDKIARWTPVMQSAFTDVKAGDSLTALLLPDQSLRFFSNGEVTTTIHDAEFSRRFLDIWLGTRTTEPKLRLKLIGQP